MLALRVSLGILPHVIGEIWKFLKKCAKLVTFRTWSTNLLFTPLILCFTPVESVLARDKICLIHPTPKIARARTSACVAKLN